MGDITFTEDEQEAIWLRAIANFGIAVRNGEADLPGPGGVALQGPYSRIPPATAEAVTGFAVEHADRMVATSPSMSPEDRRAGRVDALLRMFLLGRILGREVDAEIAAREDGNR